jgi:hypothetical protein
LRLFSENSKKAATTPTIMAETKKRIGTTTLFDAEVSPTADVSMGTVEGNKVG